MMTLAAAGAPGVMLDVLIVLATAAAVSLVFQRFRLAAIAGYLVAGAIIGPGSLGLIADTASVEAIGQVAVVLLMFGIGLHIDRSELRSGVVPIVMMGVVSTAGTIAVGAPVGLLFGLSLPAAAVLASGLAMSSTAVVLRVLQQRREMRHAHGRIAFGVLITQDLAVVVILAFIPVLAGAGTQMTASGVLLRSLLTLAVMSAVVLLGLKLLPRLLAEATKDGSNELLLVLSAAIGLGAASLTAVLGLSAELGAFLAGFLLAGTPFRYQLAGQIGPIRDLFMAVFFTAVGLSVDPVATLDIWWIVLVGLAATVAVKLVTISLSAWAFGAPPAVALTSGITLAQAGEFSLVIVGVAAAGGIFGDQREAVEGAAISVVFLSLLATPALIALSRRGGVLLVGWPQAPWLRRGLLARGVKDKPAEAPAGRSAVVAGFGPVGRAVADGLHKQGLTVTVIELNRRTVERQSELGRRVFYGDATNPDVLESAGVREADAVVLTIPDDEAMLRACQTIRRMSPTASIIVRTNYLSRAFQAKELGATAVIVEELATAQAMVGEVLGCLSRTASPAAS